MYTLSYLYSYFDHLFILQGKVLSIKCAAREVKEETELDVEKIEFLEIRNSVILNDPAHIVCIFVRAALADGDQVPENIEPDKCDGWEWYDWEKLPRPLFSPLEDYVQSGANPFHIA